MHVKVYLLGSKFKSRDHCDRESPEGVCTICVCVCVCMIYPVCVCV